MRRGVCGVLALLFLCGCSPNAREPEGLCLARVLGVDGSSPVTLTAVCAAEGGHPPVRVSCIGESLLSARNVLPWMGEREVALTGVSWLVVGRNVPLEELLFVVMEDRALSPAAALWLADGSAAALLEGAEDPAACLELLEDRGIRGLSAAGALGSLLTEGSVLLPVLTCREGRLELLGEERWHEQR